MDVRCSRKKHRLPLLLLISLGSCDSTLELPVCEATHSKMRTMGCADALKTDWGCTRTPKGGAREAPLELPTCAEARTKLETCHKAYSSADAELEAAGGGRLSLDSFVAGGCELHRELIAVNKGSGTDEVKYERRRAIEKNSYLGFYDDVEFPIAPEPEALATPELLAPPEALANLRVASPTAPSKPAVLRSLRVRGLDKKALRASIANKLPEVQSCFETGPKSARKVTVQFTVGRDGKARVAVPITGDKSVGKCVAKAIKSWTLAKPPGDAVSTAVFVPGK